MKTPNKKSRSLSPLHPSLAAVAGVTDPIPTEDPPQPPAGYMPSARLSRTLRPQHIQVELATRVAAELLASTSYTQRFGNAAPNRESIAASLTQARAWSDKLRLANDWVTYVRQQEHLAWKHAMGLVGDLKVPFEFHAGRDPSMLAELPSLATFLGESNARAKRGAATRARKKKRDEKGGAVADGAAGKAPAAPPATAVVVTDPVKTAAVKLLN
jgi:hypothetical protein